MHKKLKRGSSVGFYLSDIRQKARKSSSLVKCNDVTTSIFIGRLKKQSSKLLVYAPVVVLERRMNRHGPSCFGYRVSHAEGEWRWTAFDGLGRVVDEGAAPSRAAAAACVIRVLAELALRGEAAPEADAA